MKIIYKSH